TRYAPRATLPKENSPRSFVSLADATRPVSRSRSRTLALTTGELSPFQATPCTVAAVAARASAGPGTSIQASPIKTDTRTTLQTDAQARLIDTLVEASLVMELWGMLTVVL